MSQPANAALPDALRVLGYADRLSAQAGETIGFHVSSELGGEYRASVHRLLGGGSDPRAPRLRTAPLGDLGIFPLLNQETRPGSRGEAGWPSPIGISDATLVLGIEPRLTGSAQALAWLRGSDGGELGVQLGADGTLELVQDGLVLVATDAPLPLRRWTRAVVSWSASGVSVSVAVPGSVSLPGSADDADGWRTTDGTPAAPITDVVSLTVAARPHEGRWDRHFSGRLERPVLLPGRHTDAAAAAELAGASGPLPIEAIAGWDFARDISEWSVPGEGTDAVPLLLHQAPVRGVRGSLWSAGTDYRVSPAEFGAIHFLEDSLEDCEWIAQSRWTVPADARSGFYALHVEATDTGDEDWIPFFVRPPVGTPGADLLVVASSATYFAYANSRFWWEDPIQEIAQDRLVELGREEQYLVTHPELGLSNYDRHLDDSPVVFSSRLRPNLFMRPGHSRSESYASDLYLIAWLERSGIAYDVVTDEDVHFDGGALLAPYRAIVSGSHPEYLSIDMFDATRTWVESGGRYLYLGGNGFTSCVTWRADRPWLMENRTTADMQNDAETTATESVHQLDGTLGRAMGDSGRSAGSLFGVDSVTMGFDRSYPVLRSDVSYDPAFAGLFDGVASRLFGTRSLSGGGVIGQEWDNARFVSGSPGHHVLASSIDHSLIPRLLGADADHHGDIVAYFHGDGVVVSASAMAWVGALHIDDYDNDAERFVHNVVDTFLDAAALVPPRASTSSKGTP
jgi:N,N-dimethylformamidase